MIPRERLAYLARKIHLLGERPLHELLVELDAGRELNAVLEQYARLEPVVCIIQALDGDILPSPRVVAGRRS
jgi:hypothetical protein